MIILDTHTLVWLDQGSDRLGKQARRKIDNALQNDELLVSAISFWEIAMLTAKGRISLSQPISRWMDSLLRQGLQEVAISGALGIIAAELKDFHGDPADRIIVATTIDHSACLVTADAQILGWSKKLKCLDAAK